MLNGTNDASHRRWSYPAETNSTFLVDHITIIYIFGITTSSCFMNFVQYCRCNLKFDFHVGNNSFFIKFTESNYINDAEFADNSVVKKEFCVGDLSSTNLGTSTGISYNLPETMILFKVMIWNILCGKLITCFTIFAVPGNKITNDGDGVTTKKNSVLVSM